MIKYIGKESLGFNVQLSSIKECREYLSQLDYISLDTETEGFDPHTKRVLLLQVGGKGVEFVINTLEIDISPLKDILETKTIIFQNAKFDLRFLMHNNIDVKNIYDTFLAEIIIFGGYNFSKKDKPFFISTSLDALAKKYCNADLDKSIRGKIHRGLTEEVIQYAGDDIKYLEDIMHQQLEQLVKKDLMRVVELEMKVVRVFAKMEYKGIYFNKEKITSVIEQLDKINSDLKSTLNDVVVEEAVNNSKLKRFTKVQFDLFQEVDKTIINWGSSAQKVQVLKALGIKTNSVADKFLQMNKHKHKIVLLLVDYSKFAKLSNSFGEPLLEVINPVTQRIHAGIWQILTTGRISMSEPNLQQIPSHSELGRTIKSCFIAKPGSVLVSADYSGFELRIIAEYSQDPLWINTFKNDGDLHSVLCAETFNIPIEDVKKPFPEKPDISYRFLQKTVNFMLAYGGSKYKLADVAQIDVKEADKIIRKFFSKVPKVEKFLNRIARSGVKNGYIHTDPYYKRIRHFPNLNKEEFATIGAVERASKNTVPQGSNANIIKQALIDIQDVIDANNYPVDILLTIHDEILTECNDVDFAEEWAKILSDTMINAAKTLIKTIPVKVDPVISEFWTD